MKEELTLEKLPQAIKFLTSEVSDLKRILIESKPESNQEKDEKLWTVSQAAEFLDLSVPTIYTKVSRGQIPYMKRGKRLYFSSTELLDYLKEGRPIKEDVGEKVDRFLSNKKKGLK